MTMKSVLPLFLVLCLTPALSFAGLKIGGGGMSSVSNNADQFNGDGKSGTPLNLEVSSVTLLGPTIDINGETKGVLTSARLGGGATSYIQVSNTLQPGAVFFVSTGTASAFITGGTTITANQSVFAGNVGVAGAIPTTALNVNGAINASTISVINLSLQGRIYSTGTVTPTFSTCGSSSTISGNDTLGEIFISDLGSITSCVLVFSSPWETDPICFVTANTPTLLSVSPDILELQIISSADMVGSSFRWLCMGLK